MTYNVFSGTLNFTQVQPRPRYAYLLYNFHWATMTIKGSLQMSIAIVKAFWTEIL